MTVQNLKMYLWHNASSRFKEFNLPTSNQNNKENCTKYIITAPPEGQTFGNEKLTYPVNFVIINIISFSFELDNIFFHKIKNIRICISELLEL